MDQQAIKLRPYQTECIEQIRAQRAANALRALVVLPCGTGKTVTFAALAKEFKSALILVPKISLVKQTCEKLIGVGLKPSIYCGSMNLYEIGDYTVATFQSGINIDHQFELTIADECHKVDFESHDSQYYQIIERQKGMVVGFTATPFRNSDKIYPKYWPAPVYEKDIKWSQAMGYTVPPVAYEPVDKIDLEGIKTVLGDWDIKELSNRLEADFEKLKRQVLNVFERAQKRRHILWVCISTKHANMVGELIRAAGEECAVIHSDSEDDIEEASPLPRHIVSVMMFSEGVDIPAIDCVAMLRPTKSATLMIQVFGRALRPAEVKDNALILDFGQVIRNCGPLDSPFLDPDDKRKSSQAKYEDRSQQILVCEQCGAITVLKVDDIRKCSQCGVVEKKKISDSGLLSRADQKAQLLSENRVWYRIDKIVFATYGDFRNKLLYKDIRLFSRCGKIITFRVENPVYTNPAQNRKLYALKSNWVKWEKFLQSYLDSKNFSLHSAIDTIEHSNHYIEVDLYLAPDQEECSFFNGSRPVRDLEYNKFFGHRTVQREEQQQLF